MSTTCRCGATWTGLRMEHCTACHQTFTGAGAGDKHRVGDHALSIGPNRRRCLNPDEMRAKGMTQNSRGAWTLGGGFWQQRNDPGALGSPDREWLDPDEETSL